MEAVGHYYWDLKLGPDRSDYGGHTEKIEAITGLLPSANGSLCKMDQPRGEDGYRIVRFMLPEEMMTGNEVSRFQCAVRKLGTVLMETGRKMEIRRKPPASLARP